MVRKWASGAAVEIRAGVVGRGAVGEVKR